MRQWRVGSFSAGSVLVLSGVGLIIDRVSSTAKALDLILTWWPLALILLGIEILLAGFFSRNEQFKLKYDGWSIFLMILLFFFAMSSYALSYSGLLSHLREALTISEYPCSIPEQEIDPVGIKKVVLSCCGGGLEIRNAPGKKITILGQATLPAPSAEEAGELAKQGRAKLTTIGDTLYIQINPIAGKKNVLKGNYLEANRTVFIPSDLPLEAESSGFGSQVTLSLDSLQAPWSIRGAGPVRVNLYPELDLTLYGTVSWSQDNLSGNVNWEFEPAEDAEEHRERYNGKARLGDGLWPLVIYGEGSIEAYLHPAH